MTPEHEEAQTQAFEACSQAAKWIMKERYEFAAMKLEEARVLNEYAKNLQAQEDRFKREADELAKELA